MQLRVERHASPLGELLLVTSADGVLRALDFADYESRMRRLLGLHYGEFGLEGKGPTRALARALAAYFKGELSAFEELPIATGGSAFQRQVWRALRKIPAATTLSYGELALRLRKPGAARAIGLANAQNPIGIVVPCHRVIGKNGTLTGYAGGVERKRWLLAHEARASQKKASRTTSPLTPT